MTGTDRLVVNPRFDVEIVAPSTLFLMNEFEHVALHSDFAARVVDRCREPVKVGRLRAELAGIYSSLEIVVGLDQLVQRGHLIVISEDVDPATAFWTRLGLEPVRARRAVVAVDDLGLDIAASLEAQLSGLGVAVAATGTNDDSALDIFVVDDYLRPGLEAVNAEHLASGRSWALVKPIGIEPWIGPIFVPGETACWTCLASRLRENRQIASYVRRQRKSADDLLSRPVSVPASRDATASLAALFVAQWLQGDQLASAGRLLTLDIRALSTTTHEVVRLRYCPVCGSPPVWTVGPPRLDDEPNSGTVDGGLRAVSAEATLARLEPHVSPITGLVHRITRHSSGDDLMAVYLAQHPLFDAQGGLDSLRESLQSTTAGKGVSDAQARASALCEALERAAGRFQGFEVDARAPWSHLREEAVHPYRLLQFSDNQYDTRLDWNPRHGGFAWIPERFDDSRIVDWTAAWSLSDDRPVLLPTAFCFYNAPLEPGHVFCSADSNGSAAGNTVSEAILQGFLELVERDAVAIWWYNRLPAPGVDLDSVHDPLLDSIRDSYAARNRDMWVLDVTSDLGVPTYVACSRRRDQREEIIQGYGAHLDPGIALWRAITEMHQMLAHLGDADSAQLGDPDLRDWYTHATVARHPYLIPHEMRPWSSIPATQGPIRDEVDKAVALLRSHGLQMLVLDQTRPDVELSVVKVVVPGLRHFWPRFAPGRLYDVPVADGRLQHPLSEADLNHVPICT